MLAGSSSLHLSAFMRRLGFNFVVWLGGGCFSLICPVVGDGDFPAAFYSQRGAAQPDHSQSFRLRISYRFSSVEVRLSDPTG
jgi:hypothetical protein